MGSNSAAVPGLGAGQAFAIGLRAMLCSKFGPLAAVLENVALIYRECRFLIKWMAMLFASSATS